MPPPDISCLKPASAVATGYDAKPGLRQEIWRLQIPTGTVKTIAITGLAKATNVKLESNDLLGSLTVEQNQGPNILQVQVIAPATTPAFYSLSPNINGLNTHRTKINPDELEAHLTADYLPLIIAFQQPDGFGHATRKVSYYTSRPLNGKHLLAFRNNS